MPADKHIHLIIYLLLSNIILMLGLAAEINALDPLLAVVAMILVAVYATYHAGMAFRNVLPSFLQRKITSEVSE